MINFSGNCSSSKSLPRNHRVAVPFLRPILHTQIVNIQIFNTWILKSWGQIFLLSFLQFLFGWNDNYGTNLGSCFFLRLVSGL